MLCFSCGGTRIAAVVFGLFYAFSNLLCGRLGIIGIALILEVLTHVFLIALSVLWEIQRLT